MGAESCSVLLGGQAFPCRRLGPARSSPRCLTVISLAQFALAYTRSWAANSVNQPDSARCRTDNSTSKSPCCGRNSASKSPDGEPLLTAVPHFSPTNTWPSWNCGPLAAGRWSGRPRSFWSARLPSHRGSNASTKKDPDALLQPRGRSTSFLTSSAPLSSVFKALPRVGKVKIAETLARAGLHLGATTVGRILKGARRSGAANDVEHMADAGGHRRLPITSGTPT